MSMDPVILSRVQDKLFSLRVSREAQAAERQQELFAKFPRLREIEAELGSTAARIMRAAVADGSDYRPRFEEMKKRNLELQAERTEILVSGGLSADALEVQSDCPDCGDTGFLSDGSPCKCLLRGYAEEQISELETWLPTRRATFDTFDENLYSDVYDESWKASPRENAVAVRDACRAFAANLKNSESIVITGGAGVGKSFLASCVAVEASRHARSVCCRTMAELTALHEREKFSYDDDVRDAAQAEIERLERCDLLIIDSLGGEFRSALSVTVLLGTLTTRIAAKKRTFICTTLDESEFEGRYNAEIASRLVGDFEVLPLFGEDLRRK